MNEQGKTLTQCGVLGDGAKKHVREQNVVTREIKCTLGLKTSSSNKNKNNNNLLTLSTAQGEVLHGVRSTPTPTPPTITPKLTSVWIQNHMPFQGSEYTTLSVRMDLLILT